MKEVIYTPAEAPVSVLVYHKILFGMSSTSNIRFVNSFPSNFVYEITFTVYPLISIHACISAIVIYGIVIPNLEQSNFWYVIYSFTCI